MLGASLIFSMLILAIAWYAAQPAPHRMHWITFILGGGFISLFSLCSGFIPPSCVFVASLVALGVWQVARGRLRSFPILAPAVLVLGYAAAAALVYPLYAKYDSYRQKYPFESMETRLPTPTSLRTPLPAASELRLVAFEEKATEKFSRWGRTLALRELHEENANLFIASAGFGVGRRIRPDPSSLDHQQERPEPPYQPDPSPRVELPVDTSVAGLKRCTELGELVS